MMVTPLFIGGIGMQEVLLIVLVVLLFFGGKKIPELMKGIGKGVRSFKEGMNNVEKEIDEIKDIEIVAVAVVFGIVVFFFKEQLFGVVLVPKDDGFITYQLLNRMAAWAGGAMESFSVRLINTGLARQFIIHMKTALCAGVLCASPYILYQLFRFVSPTLYDNERRYITQTVGVSSVMFGFGGQLLSDLSTDFSLFVNISGKW